MSIQPSEFEKFRQSYPGRAMFRKLGLLDYLDSATSWRSLRAIIVEFNGCDEGRFVDLARQCDGVASSGERVLLHAICYVTDFAWLADELAAGGVWHRMDRVSGEWRDAVCACIRGEGLL